LLIDMTTIELTRFRVRPEQVEELLAARPEMLKDFTADRPGIARFFAAIDSLVTAEEGTLA
jgi:hypothetical protein